MNGTSRSKTVDDRNKMEEIAQATADPWIHPRSPHDRKSEVEWFDFRELSSCMVSSPIVCHGECTGRCGS